MNTLQLLTIILPIIALVFVLIIAFVNVFLVLRKHYPIKVNCWFCNSYTQVHYEERNSFYCSSCQQYNGFSEDGDYNKLIPEQHDEMLNSLLSVRQITGRVSNGLCRFCNNNQQLKIHQLAAFVPLNENTYDIEVQHFKNLLEKAYKLCPKCEQSLHHTLTEQNKQLIGQRILSMHRRSMAYLDINKSSKHATVQQKKVIFNILLLFTLTLISLLLFMESIQNCNISDVTTIKRILPRCLHPFISDAKKYLKTMARLYYYYFDSVSTIHEVQEIRNYINSTFTPVKHMIEEQLNMNITTHNQYIKYLLASSILNRVRESFYEVALTICGVFLQLCTFLLVKHNVYTTVLWIFLLLIPYVPLEPYITSILKILVLIVIVYQTLNFRHLNTTSDKYKTIKTSVTTLIDDSSAVLSTSSDSKLSASTNYFNLSGTSNKSFHNLNGSPHSTTRSRKSINRSPINPARRLNESASFLFGSKAVLENPLSLKAQSLHCNRSFSESSKSFSKHLIDNEAYDIETGIMKLSLGKAVSTIYKPKNVFRSRPIVSPPNFIYTSKCTTSWSTDNWLKQEEPRFSSRCSSQTSGFVSIAPNDALNTSQNSLSLPDSASSSVCGDLDRSSVVSEPIHTSFSSSVLGMNLNHSTASTFKTLMNKTNFNNGRMNGNNIGLFKPLVFNSDEL